MSQSDRLLLRILRGTSDANISFEGLCQLLRRLGFDERIRGSHHIFTEEGGGRDLKLAATRQASQTLSGQAGKGAASAVPPRRSG